MGHKNEEKISKNLHWQLFMLFLSIYVLIALFLQTLPIIQDPGIEEILTIVDNVVCVIFISDFFYTLFTVEDKKNFLKLGWIDLISSIPTVSFLRWGRFFRIVRIFRILRGIRSIKVIFQFIFANKAKGTLLTVTLISFVLVIFGAVAILNCETHESSNIKNATDALWWAFVTITTVGYGDYYPVTTLGRIVAAILMTAGVGLFGTFTAYVSSYFLQLSEVEEEISDIEDESQLMQRKLDTLLEEVNNIKKEIRHMKYR